MILLPTSTEYSTVHWTPVGETEIYECLDDDNGDTSYVKCSANLRHIRLGYASPSVAEANISSISSVRFLSSGRANHRTSVSATRVDYVTPSGNAANIPNYDPGAVYETINGTARTTSDGSSAAWTYSDLESLEMKVTKTGTIELYLSYFVMEVTYTIPADNATFFGANF